MTATDWERIESALANIPAEDRTTWLQVGNALKTALGDDGFDVWVQWSRGADNYDAPRIRTDWNSLRAGMVSQGTLFYLAKQNGWPGEPGTLASRPARPSKPEPTKETPQEIVDEIKDAIARASIQAGHPYLVSKGFPDFPVLIHTGPDLKRKRTTLVKTGDIILPMIKGHREDFTSIQTIDQEGVKKFWPGSIAAGGYFRLGRDPEYYIVEGFATGLSVREVMTVLGRRYSIFVAFSAAGVRSIAHPGSKIVADHDLNICTELPKLHRTPEDVSQLHVVKPTCPKCGAPITRGAGQKYALQTGCLYWIPTEPGDANDYHKDNGLYALVHELRPLIFGHK